MTNLSKFADTALLDALTDIASQAASAIMRVRAKGVIARTKSDSSPVTEADDAAEAIILDELARVMPGMAVVSEEAASRTEIIEVSDPFILVDPLDGTREFIESRDEFTVNIAIVANGRPVVGIVGAPALNTIWRGIVGKGSERLQLPPGATTKNATDRTALHAHAHAHGGGTWRAMMSRSHHDPATDDWLRRFSSVERLDCGSSIKFCRIAEGRADIYPRLGRTSEWDIAAGDAVLSAAGGVVLTPDGEPLRYGQIARHLKVPSFIAWSNAGDAAKFTAG
jgi:3'(2'), 5'-bisphosphate nucleotidase